MAVFKGNTVTDHDSAPYRTLSTQIVGEYKIISTNVILFVTVYQNLYYIKLPVNNLLSIVLRGLSWYTLFFNKNMFYKNIEAEICKILRIF